MNLKNKKVLITGATGGIGNSLVKKFLEGQSTILATGSNEAKLTKIKDEFKDIQIEKFNLAEHSKIESFIDTANDKLLKTGKNMMKKAPPAPLKNGKRPSKKEKRYNPGFDPENASETTGP